MQSDRKNLIRRKKSLNEKSFHFLWNIINQNEIDFKALIFYLKKSSMRQPYNKNCVLKDLPKVFDADYFNRSEFWSN